LSGERPTLLRPGAITRAELERVLRMPVADAGQDAPRASGRLASHYAPQKPLEVVPQAVLPARMAELRPFRLAVLAPPPLIKSPPPHVVVALEAPLDPAAYARALYAHLRALDASGAERLLVAAPPAQPEWAAVNDRLRRAQGSNMGSPNFNDGL
jgi:L-threonylcarbamoyladenylate synthase